MCLIRGKFPYSLLYVTSNIGAIECPGGTKGIISFAGIAEGRPGGTPGKEANTWGPGTTQIPEGKGIPSGT